VRWVEVVEVEAGPAVGLAEAADVGQAGWAAPRLPGQAATASAPAAGSASRIRWACPATSSSVPNAARR
jgi:hypothetical protein